MKGELAEVRVLVNVLFAGVASNRCNTVTAPVLWRTTLVDGEPIDA